MNIKIIQELTDEEVRMGFAASCIEAAARRVGCSYLDMYRRMKRVELVNELIIRHYDTMHTMSREYITDDVLEALGNWERRESSTSFAATGKGGPVC